MIVCVCVSLQATHTKVKQTLHAVIVSRNSPKSYIYLWTRSATDVLYFFSFTRRVEVEDNCYYSTITKLKSYHDAPCAAMQHIFDEPA